MSANERFQADVEQTKADFSQLKSDAERKVAEAKVEDEAVFRGVSAEAKTRYEGLQAQRAQLKSIIDTKTGEARVRMQADLDHLDSEIAASRAAMAEYFERRDAGQVGLN